MSKRAKFIIVSVILACGFIGIGLLAGQYRFLGIGALSLGTLLLFAWSLWEGLGKNATLLVLLLPPLYTLGVGLFWFLLPSVILARIPIILMYAIGMYALSLTMNIFTVSAIRTIALVRAARGVGFVLTLFTMFLLFDAVASWKAPIYVSTLVVFLVSTVLTLQSLWSSKLSTKISKRTVLLTIIVSWSITTVSFLLYFWPVSIVVNSLFLTSAAYVLLGLSQAYEEGRLFMQTTREYLVTGALVFLAMLLVTNWRA